MSDTDLSSRIRQRREQLSLSQEELAARMATASKSSITKLEKGIKRPAPGQARGAGRRSGHHTRVAHGSRRPALPSAGFRASA